MTARDLRETNYVRLNDSRREEQLRELYLTQKKENIDASSGLNLAIFLK